MSNDAIYNTNFDCEELGIHYQVSTPSSFFGTGKRTEFRRRNNQSGYFEIIAQWERRTFQRDTFKFTRAGSSGPNGDEVPVSKFLTQKNGLSML